MVHADLDFKIVESYMEDTDAYYGYDIEYLFSSENSSTFHVKEYGPRGVAYNFIAVVENGKIYGIDKSSELIAE